jgi:hypothetical protein
MELLGRSLDMHQSYTLLRTTTSARENIIDQAVVTTVAWHCQQFKSNCLDLLCQWLTIRNAPLSASNGSCYQNDYMKH